MAGEGGQLITASEPPPCESGGGDQEQNTGDEQRTPTGTRTAAGAEWRRSRSLVGTSSHRESLPRPASDAHQAKRVDLIANEPNLAVAEQGVDPARVPAAWIFNVVERIVRGPGVGRLPVLASTQRRGALSSYPGLRGGVTLPVTAPTHVVIGDRPCGSVTITCSMTHR